MAEAIANEYILNLSQDNLPVFTNGSKDEKIKFGAGVVIPHQNFMKIINDTAISAR